MRAAVVGIATRAAAVVIAGAFFVMSRVPPTALSAAAGWLGRTVGPRLPRSKVARDNLKHAFPGKAERELRAIERGMWDNLFRTVAEGTQIGRFCDFSLVDGSGERLTIVGGEHGLALRDDGKPGIIFTAHLGNWELLPAAAARAGLEIASLFRAPNMAAFAGMVELARSTIGAPLISSRPGAAFELASVLGSGGHVGLLVDQKFSRRSRVAVPFFGRPVNANPLLAQLARRFDCPVHGARMIRHPGARHTIEITGPVVLPRGEDGAIDIERATACVTAIIEGWVREHPEQWLWAHKRWVV
jgi:KDO2-lipid IV(A) lauroyltransferase